MITHAEFTKENEERIEEDSRQTRRTLRNLPTIDVEKSFTLAQSKGVLAAFEKDFRDIFFKFDLAMVAAVDDPKYFYRRNVTYEVVRRALDFAKKRFDNIPILNLVTFIIVQVHDMIIEQRTFHQNMLLHYLQNHEGELNFKK